MRRIIYLYLMGILLLSSCKDADNFMPETGADDGISILLETQQMETIETRATKNIDADSRIDHVIIYAFDKNGNQVGDIIAQNLDETSIVSKKVTSDTKSIYYQLRAILNPGSGITQLYAVCNYPELASEPIFKQTDLEAKVLQGENKADCAFSNVMVMSGKVENLTDTKISDKNTPIVIPVKRIAAKIDFIVSFEPYDTSDKFLLTSVEIHKIPLKSNLIEKTTDAVSGGNVNENFIDVSMLNMEEVTEQGKKKNMSQLYLYENRYNPTDNMYFQEKQSDPNMWQTLKGALGREKYPNASFLRIKGFYQTGAGTTRRVSYDVYIGENNFSDFSVKRNHYYTINATIKTVDIIDTRVTSKILNSCQIEPAFHNPFDAHFGVGRCYAYSVNKNWELYVEDPDHHPWLEISFSPQYRPRIAGHTIPTDSVHLYANTRFVGDGTRALSEYFYVHVDEFIPETAPGATEDVNVAGGKNIVFNSDKWRKGAVVLIDKENGTFSRIEITQRPAQLVRMAIKNVLGKPTGEYHEYFVEYEQERKNLIWGFLQYPVNPTMTSMINDVVDGLSNTRKLYNEAVKPNGAYNDAKLPPFFKPCDTPEQAAARLPMTDMIGYAMSKNRDRNGNGCIDQDEIVWYVPAVNELLELWRAMEEGKLEIEDQEDRFYTSNPSASGYTEEIPGRAYYVKTKNGKKVKAFVMRDHKYNVICCRRKNAWRGPEDSNVDGGITIDPEWGEGEDVITGGSPDNANN